MGYHKYLESVESQFEFSTLYHIASIFMRRVSSWWSCWVSIFLSLFKFLYVMSESSIIDFLFNPLFLFLLFDFEVLDNLICNLFHLFLHLIFLNRFIRVIRVLFVRAWIRHVFGPSKLRFLFIIFLLNNGTSSLNNRDSPLKLFQLRLNYSTNCRP